MGDVLSVCLAQGNRLGHLTIFPPQGTKIESTNLEGGDDTFDWFV